MRHRHENTISGLAGLLAMLFLLFQLSSCATTWQGKVAQGIDAVRIAAKPAWQKVRAHYKKKCGPLKDTALTACQAERRKAAAGFKALLDSSVIVLQTIKEVSP